MGDKMTELERELIDDLDTLGDRLADEELTRDLYRALTNNVWRKRGAEGHVSLSWGRAEEIVNSLRERLGLPPVELAQTGGEGEVSTLAGEELARLGWSSTPLNTSRHDPAHAERPESPPPREQGEAQAPVEDSRGWEREAHREAEDARLGDKA